MRYKSYKANPGCAVEACLEVIGGKWKGVILYHLLDGTRRFGELRRLLPGVTQRMLTAQLRELETDGVIERKVYPQVPPKVEYSLTEFGRTLEPIVVLMRKWGEQYLARRPEMLAAPAAAGVAAGSAREPRTAHRVTT